MFDRIKNALSDVLARKAKAEKDAAEMAKLYPEYLPEALDSVEKLDKEIWEFRQELLRCQTKPKKHKAKPVLLSKKKETSMRQSWIEAVQDHFKLKEAESLHEQKKLKEEEDREQELQELLSMILGKEERQPVYKPVMRTVSVEPDWEEKQVKWAARRALANFGGNIKY